MKAWELSGMLLEFVETGELDLARSILDVLLTDTQSKIEALRALPNIRVARQIAHSLKGAARQVGIDDLADEAEKLETTSENLDSIDYALMVQTIEHRWYEAKKSILLVRDRDFRN